MKQIPLYEKIYNDISEAIDRAYYKPGDKLPSEKELSEQYQVSRITSKRALEMLAEEKRIVRIVGKGSFIADENNNFALQLSSSLKQPHDIRLLGVVMEGFGASFGTTLLENMEKECQAQGFTMVLKITGGSIEKETKAIDELRLLGVEGMILMCSQNENYNPQVLKMVVEAFPIVTIDRKLTGIPVSHVGTNNFAAARDLTRYLLKKGVHNICFAMPAAENTPTLNERRKGFVSGLNEANILPDESYWLKNLQCTLPSAHSAEMVQRDIKRIHAYMQKHPNIEAFLAAEDSIATLLNKCLKEARLESIPIVCFDSVDSITNEPLFAHVKQDEKTLGKTAIQLLTQHIAEPQDPQTILIPYKIVPAIE